MFALLFMTVLGLCAALGLSLVMVSRGSAQAQQLWYTGLVDPRPEESSWTRN